MTDFSNFQGAAKRLDDIDIPRIGHRIGVGEDELHAFMDVECAGAGFDTLGRPKMLFEPHVFYRNLPAGKRDTAVKLGLAYPTWGSKPYPKNSYPRLVQAMAIDETAALKSASWGLGQILGENYAMVGYSSPQAMVLAFMEDEEHHLEAIVEFLIKAGIDDDLRAHRWLTVARVYNGPAHAKHNYAGRMATAFAKWQKIKDTPWTPGDPGLGPVAPDETMPVLRKGDGWTKNLKLRPYVAKAQNRLMLHGFDPGAFDGKFGDKTLKAVFAFQKARGFTPDGVIGGFETWPALLAEPTTKRKTEAFHPDDLADLPAPVVVPPKEPIVVPANVAVFDSSVPAGTIIEVPPDTFDDGGSYTPEIIATALMLAAMAAAVYFII